ncbi:hypothetical protein OSB04_030856 [Centaurea solstitialis]|uniref:Uncharacterized protein n=1 Tax=Centaurea solstitialis TaxID=347529 RepID=A0AA38S992_9ASTR|nr:hypothetical protein OSB04_030856 [Centaurea solstitialis]
MSAVGFDFRNERCVVAVAKHTGIVYIDEEQDFLGTNGSGTRKKYPESSISLIMRWIIGRPFSDPELQQYLKALPFSVTEGPDGFPLIHARYGEETRSFTSIEIMGMVFSNMKRLAENMSNAPVVDCCIGIPVYFTYLQRSAVLEAAKIVGLNPLRLMHETTATALAYGIYKTGLFEDVHRNVAFVDIGHASMQVCIANYKKGEMKILAHSFDRCLVGRGFDEVLYQHFAAKFKADYEIDVFQNAYAGIQLRDACEKLKEELRSNPEALLYIECLIDMNYVRCFIKRDEFKQISSSILERLKKPLEKALSEAKILLADIYAVEVVGSDSWLIRILTDYFGKKPRNTMNASECVSKGCALECAIFSPNFKVRDFQVNEILPFSIALQWKGFSSMQRYYGEKENLRSCIVFPIGNPIPSVKSHTFYVSGTFSLEVQYAYATEMQAPAEISTFTVKVAQIFKIGPFMSTKYVRPVIKVEVEVGLNLDGCVSVNSAKYPDHLKWGKWRLCVRV